MGRLRNKQSLLVKCIQLLLQYAHEQGWEFTFGEAYVANPRKVRTHDGAVVQREDALHMKGSLHYRRLAIDLNLFVDGTYVRSGEHPAWHELGQYWESLDPLCRWGGRFNDANHFSVTEGGKA